ncbi:hypothetical protein PAN31117_01772 [Pandoraea anapnoica]|uniref:Uncharacterized protein n=1 Tax=Pandoraea anapnoica TaxID=2508301 RepID=A0A5E4ZVU9_9BURK|nr:hypothetical protein [Pandoraea anapnoica]VVE65146.1 hypothetical protein PAN31117_01772 [Pandoraea anapnoica]
MPAEDPSCLSERHLLAFAKIVRCFAHYEFTIDTACCALTKCEPTCFSLLTRPLDFRARRVMLLDVLRQVGYPMDRYDRISACLMVPFTYSMLLHDILHSRWVRHSEGGGIQPAWIFDLAPSVEPHRDWCDECVEEPLPRSADDHAYSLDQLETVARRLSAEHRALVAYLMEIGLLPASSNAAID